MVEGGPVRAKWMKFMADNARRMQITREKDYEILFVWVA